jgi:hypothetical protein
MNVQVHEQVLLERRPTAPLAELLRWKYTLEPEPSLGRFVPSQ